MIMKCFFFLLLNVKEQQNQEDGCLLFIGISSSFKVIKVVSDQKVPEKDVEMNRNQ